MRHFVGRIANLPEDLGKQVDELAAGLRSGGLAAQLALSDLIRRIEQRADALERGVADTDAPVTLTPGDDDEAELLAPLMQAIGFLSGVLCFDVFQEKEC